MILRHLAEVVKEIKPEVIDEAKRFKEKVWNEKEIVRLFTILKASGLDTPPLYPSIHPTSYRHIRQLLEMVSRYSNPHLEYMTIGIVVQLSK